MVHRALPAGIYSVRWDGRDAFGRPLASGIYLYRLRAGNDQHSRRLVLPLTIPFYMDSGTIGLVTILYGMFAEIDEAFDRP